MATAQTFIEAALRRIGVKSAEVPLKTSELSNGLDALNDMGNQLEAEGFELGFTTLSAVGDTVTIPAYANDFYKSNLAGRLAPEYSVEVSQTLVATLQAARRSVIRNLNRKAVGLTGTYQNLIFAAIEMLGAKSDDEPISSVEITNALPRLNDYLLELESRGFNLGYSISGGDVTKNHDLPDWCLSWIKSGLAIRMAPTYGIEVSQALAELNRQAESAVYNQYAEVPLSDLPSTLPTGSNSHQFGDRFYRPTTENQILDGNGRPLTEDLGIILTDGD